MDSALYQSDAILRPLVYRPLSLQAAIVSVHGPPWLHFEPLQLLNFVSDAAPQDPEPDPSSLGRYVFGSEISYNKAPPRLPGLAY